VAKTIEDVADVEQEEVKSSQHKHAVSPLRVPIYTAGSYKV